MSVWLPAFFSALAGLLIAAFAWATRRREQSGKIDTSSAAVLWAAINKMLETALTDNADQRAEMKELTAEVGRLRGQMAEATQRVTDLHEEIARLRTELRELRGKVS